MIRTIYDPPVITGICPGCEQTACRCHDAAFMEEYRKPRYVRKADRDYYEQRAIEAEIENAPPDKAVLLASVPVPFEDGLIIEGVATTRGWDRYDTLLPPKDWSEGDTMSRHRGRVMRKMERRLPVPLLVSHDPKQRIGVMFEARASEDKLRFRAAIAPPGTPDYDTTLLVQTWSDIRSEKLQCVSFAARDVTKEGTWKPSELSICPQGANPLAVITHVRFPDDFSIYREELPYDAALVRSANDAFYAAHYAKLKAEEEARAAETRAMNGTSQNNDPPDHWRGVWKAGKQYNRADTATHDGALWYAHTTTTNKPGASRDWQLMSKTADRPRTGGA